MDNAPKKYDAKQTARLPIDDLARYASLELCDAQVAAKRLGDYVAGYISDDTKRAPVEVRHDCV